MNLHEYQAKALLRDYDVPSAEGGLATSPDDAACVARRIGGTAWAVKAQIHAGLRQKAGGIRLVHTVEAVAKAAAALIGSRLVTPQTGPAGKVVKSVYVEQAIAYDRALYLAALVDRAASRVALIAARDGGDDIEDRVAADPETLRRLVIDPDTGLDREAAKRLAHDLALSDDQAEQAVAIMAATYRALLDHDAGLIEYNPLVVADDGKLLALDAKMVLDDNALFRHQDLERLRDEDELGVTELEARRHELNYVKLGGNIGVMVNGAGLALATIDLLKDHGGEPADFMDIRPEANRDQVARGFRLLLDNPQVGAILVNIYGGGILRCDTVAEGIAAACRGSGLRVPLVVRAAGTNCEIARKALTSQGVPVIFANSMADAADKVVRAAKREAA